jgi:hypothetical protein
MFRQLLQLAAEDLRYHVACLGHRWREGRGLQRPAVLVNGSPKTGTTWVRHMIASLPGYRYVGNLGGEIGAYRELEPGAVAHGHDPYNETLETILKETGLKTVLMMRDPRDQLISRLFHIKRSPGHKWHARIKRMSIEEGLMACMRGGAGLPSMATMIRFTQHWLDSGACFHLVRYEDLLADPHARLQEIMHFLGVATDVDALTAAIVARNRFERLTLGRKIWKTARSPGEGDASSHFRKGIKGDWRNYMKEEHVDFFKANAGETLIAWGYEPGMDWEVSPV